MTGYIVCEPVAGDTSDSRHELPKWIVVTQNLAGPLVEEQLL